MSDATGRRDISSDGIQGIVEASRRLASGVDAILPPVTVLERCSELAASNNRLRRRVIVRTEA